MSDLFPQVTSDEIDPEAAAEQAKRDAEIISDKPPHHQDYSELGVGDIGDAFGGSGETDFFAESVL